MAVLGPDAAPRRQGEQRLGLLSYAALGIVFGDIGTSPLYALRESFFGAHAAAGIWRLCAHYGFMESPDIPNAVAIAEELGLIPGLRERDATCHLGRTIVLPSGQKPGMARWREHLFTFMARNALNATAFYRIPPERMVELGVRIEI